MTELDSTCVSAYTLALRHGSFHEATIMEKLGISPGELAHARDALRAMGLLSSAGGGSPLVAVHPEVAEAIACGPLERDIHEHEQRIARMRGQLHALVPVYQDSAGSAQPADGTRTVHDPAEVQRQLAAAARRCRHEAVAIQPSNGRDAEAVQHARAWSLALLRRGVRMRILYQHAERASLATRAYVCQAAEAGAEVRTSAEVCEHLVVFDRSLVFVPQSTADGGGGGAALVTNTTVAEFMYRRFEDVWMLGQPFDPQEAPYEKVADELNRTVLHLMAAGLKDEVIARRLAVSTRTCRRYMKAAMAELGAVSRFQAGARAAELGLLRTPVPHVPRTLDTAT
ncbi:helix-turn-helix transcriptional regulator [Streptomyces sp. ISL-11]|uniref:helix-turn-helix transcriptional regulator n=1 Tax=Streptomyces sp. ISL-11 TaxID=2819174 RepID=UPI001BEAA4B0|nr:helix-turn-helix transcriptional regulator [Streptomyces sp. ISL-11]MBT2383994.1 helix-turn-helix transcriptional regulator [Streptomyces sp. ISL-11]